MACPLAPPRKRRIGTGKFCGQSFAERSERMSTCPEPAASLGPEPWSPGRCCLPAKVTAASLSSAHSTRERERSSGKRKYRWAHSASNSIWHELFCSALRPPPFRLSFHYPKTQISMPRFFAVVLFAPPGFSFWSRHCLLNGAILREDNAWLSLVSPCRPSPDALAAVCLHYQFPLYSAPF